MAKIVRKPFYQDIDGIRCTAHLLPDIFRSAFRYKPTPDDFFIITYPKCGTHWVHHIVNLIYHGGGPIPPKFASQFPHLELVGIEGIEMMQRPCAIRTHLPYRYLPMSPDAKYLYLTRNPKDTLVSLYHHTRGLPYEYEDGEFCDFFEIFLNGETEFGDFFDHLLGWYEHRHDPNVLVLTYEELKRDTGNTVRKMAEFMGPQHSQLLEDDSVLENVLKLSSFDHMKSSMDVSFDANETDGATVEMPTGLKHVRDLAEKYHKESGKNWNFVRKGIVGDWRSLFTEDQSNRMDAKIEAKLRGTELLSYWKSIECI